MSTGAIVAAAVRRTERRLIEHLRGARAVGRSSAAPIPEQKRAGRRVVRLLLAAGAIREVGAGSYYLDEAAYAAYRSRRTRTIGLVVVPLAVVVVLIIWWANAR